MLGIRSSIIGKFEGSLLGNSPKTVRHSCDDQVEGRLYRTTPSRGQFQLLNNRTVRIAPEGKSTAQESAGVKSWEVDGGGQCELPVLTKKFPSAGVVE
jgi:hypothetical protein